MRATVNEETQNSRSKKSEVGDAEKNKAAIEEAPQPSASGGDQEAGGGQQGAGQKRTIQERKAELHEALSTHIEDEARRTRIGQGKATEADHETEAEAQREAARGILARQQPQP